VGIEADALAAPDGLDRDDVPDVLGDDVSDEEVDFGRGVGDGAGPGGFDPVAGFGVAGGGFDLDAEESVAMVDDGVVALAVSPGEADGEVEVSGAGEEGGFGGFPATLAGGSGDGVEGDDGGEFWEVEVFPAGFDQDYGCIEVSHNGTGAAAGCAWVLLVMGSMA